MITLPCLIVRGKKSSSWFNSHKRVTEWPKNTHTILRNFDTFPPGSFYSTPLNRGSGESSAIAPSCLCGYFVGPNFFLVGISWVSNFFLWVFRESQSFSSGYFVGQKFFLVGISWVQNNLSYGEFCKFQLLAGWEKVA